METDKPIQIPEEKVIEAAQAGMDEFLKVFTDAYWERIGGSLTAETMPLLTGEQHVLLGYQIFRDEVLEGGFVQLIQNGYGPYIFENPFAKAMRLFGMKEFSKLIYKARKIYDAHKDDLTRDCTDEEFMAMYERYEGFDPLEETFIEEEEDITRGRTSGTVCRNHTDINQETESCQQKAPDKVRKKEKEVIQNIAIGLR